MLFEEEDCILFLGQSEQVINVNITAKGWQALVLA